MNLRRAICIMLFAAVAAKNAAVDASFSSDDLFKRPNVDGLEDLDHWLDTYHPHEFDTQGIDTQARVEFDEFDIGFAKASMGYLDHTGQPEYPSADHDRTWPSMPPMHQGLDSGHPHPYSTSQSDNPSHQGAASQQITHPNAALSHLPMPQGSTPVPTSNSQPAEPAQTRQSIIAISRRRKPQAPLPGNSSQALKGISKRSAMPPKQNNSSKVSAKQTSTKKERRDWISYKFTEKQKQAILAFWEQPIICEHCNEAMNLHQASWHYKFKHPGMGCKEITVCNDCGAKLRYTSASEHQLSNVHWDKFNPPDITTHEDPTRIWKAKSAQSEVNRMQIERRAKIKKDFSKKEKLAIVAYEKHPINCEHCNEVMTLSQAPYHYRKRHLGMGCKKKAHCDDCGANFSYTAAHNHHVTNQHWDKFYPFSVPALGK